MQTEKINLKNIQNDINIKKHLFEKNLEMARNSNNNEGIEAIFKNVDNVTDGSNGKSKSNIFKKLKKEKSIDFKPHESICLINPKYVYDKQTKFYLKNKKILDKNKNVVYKYKGYNTLNKSINDSNGEKLFSMKFRPKIFKPFVSDIKVMGNDGEVVETVSLTVGKTGFSIKTFVQKFLKKRYLGMVYYKVEFYNKALNRKEFITVRYCSPFFPLANKIYYGDEKNGLLLAEFQYTSRSIFNITATIDISPGVDAMFIFSLIFFLDSTYAFRYFMSDIKTCGENFMDVLLS